MGLPCETSGSAARVHGLARLWRFARRPATWEAVCALAAGLLLVALLFTDEYARAGGGKFLRSDWAACLLWLLPPLLLLRRWRAASPESFPRDSGPRAGAPALILLACMTLYLFSGAAKHPWFYFLSWPPGQAAASGALKAELVNWVLLTCLLLPFVLVRRRSIWVALLIVLAASELAAFFELIRATGGAPLYRDDHPSFLFRLWEFSRTFPRLITYNPYWNGGVVNFVGTTSATTAIGLPLYPFWRFLPTHAFYTWGVGLIYLVAVPWIAVASLRIMGAGRAAAFCAGILALGVSRHFFLWMLHFGTVGSVFASTFVAPVTACVFRAVWMRRREPWLFAALAASAFFLAQWFPCALLAVPLAAGALLAARRWRLPTWVFLAAAGLLVLALMARPLAVVLVAGRRLMDYVLDEPVAGAQAAIISQTMLAAGCTRLAAHLQEGHPVLTFLGLGGVLVLPYRGVRRWCAPILLFFALLAGWGPELVPNLQLGRMAVLLYIAAVIPASLLAARILRSGGAGAAVARAALLALLALGGRNVARLYAGEGHAPYTVVNAQVRELTDWIRANTPADGRVLFAGRCVHYYGRGHVAYLPRYAGREMMACDYYAFPPGMTEYNYPPRPFRDPEARLFEFMELYNVTHVATYHDGWKAAFRRHPDQFEEARAFPDGRTVIFRVRRSSSLFLRGAGAVSADFNRLRVRVENPAEQAVIKYNWSDALRAPPPVELFPFDAGDGVRLIGIRPGGRAAFDIRFRSWL